jgi:hypothetical protein
LQSQILSGKILGNGELYFRILYETSTAFKRRVISQNRACHRMKNVPSAEQPHLLYTSKVKTWEGAVCYMQCICLTLHSEHNSFPFKRCAFTFIKYKKSGIASPPSFSKNYIISDTEHILCAILSEWEIVRILYWTLYLSRLHY